MQYDRKPRRFLEIIVHRIQPLPGLTGLCARYEQGEWRYRRLVEHLVHWLPEFALNYRELENFSHATWLDQVVQAARLVYTSSVYQGRGELGELLLHVAMRETFDTVPAISKIYFKDANNDTVKGFDAVHVVYDKTKEELDLWLGEVRFYKDIRSAIRDVVKELGIHCDSGYLKQEFAAILRKVDPSFPLQSKIAKLLDPNVSLDQIFR
jgi:Cap4 SAVED domain